MSMHETRDELEIPQIGSSDEHDALLHSVMPPLDVETLRSPEVQHVIDRLLERLRNGGGVGIAAPQAGFALRIAVLRDVQEFVDRWPEHWIQALDRRIFPERVVVNPVLTLGEETAEWYEGCLSKNGDYGLKRRATTVCVEAYDRDGHPFTHEAHGWEARVYQHEVDHLNGKLCFEAFTPGSEITADEFQALKSEPFPPGLP